MPNREVHEVYLDKLGVDVCNIRCGFWDYDEELVNSVKTAGIKQPLVVRPISDGLDEKEYGIVCGSRRYHAALVAGLEKVPCLIDEMDDLEAYATSMIENRQRSDTPTWADIEYVGKIYNAIENRTHKGKTEYITEKTGMSCSTVEKYLNIFSLPEEIKGLLRKPNERTKRQEETLMLYQTRLSDRVLSIGSAACLVEMKDLDLNKLMEMAVFIMDKSVEIAEKLVTFVRMYPDKSISEIYNEMIRKVYGIYEKVFRFDSETWRAIENACMDRQMPYDTYIKKIIRERLHKDGYLGVKETIDLEIAEEEKDFVIIKCSRSLLEKCGYKYLKNEGDKRIYQKPIGAGTGGFYKAFTKGHTTCVRLTPGNYDDETETLKIEKKKLLEFKHNV